MVSPYYAEGGVTVYHGDCLDVLAELPDASVDSVVCDPPYDLTNRTPDVLGCESCGRTLGGRDGKPDACPRCGGELTRQRSKQGKGFMGKEWDGTGIAFRPDVWIECLRVLKPGGHLLAFGGTRTWHRLACAVEDAGFEVRDSIAWLYGSGFPKSLDVSKAIDKAAGAERTEVVGSKLGRPGMSRDGSNQRHNWADAFGADVETHVMPTDITAPATPDAARWQGWGTALKPAFEPVVVARKPLQGTVAGNVLAWGTGALNIDGCRIEGPPSGLKPYTRSTTPEVYALGMAKEGRDVTFTDHPAGRWPANVALDEDQAAALDQQSGERPGFSTQRDAKDDGDSWLGTRQGPARAGVVREGFNDKGGASRFFYTAKAPGTERVRIDGIAHPTVKPLDLMRWLVRLVCPPGGTVLEPFAGSGTTVEACILEGFDCIAIEREADYMPLITQRIHRRIDPVAAVKASGDDGGLFDLLGEETA